MFRGRTIGLTGKYRMVLAALLSMVVLNLTVGIMAYRYLGKIDADYSEAMGNAIRSQNLLRLVSMQTTRTLANAMLFLNKETRTEDRRNAIKEAGEVSDEIYKIMMKGPFPSPEMKQDFELLRQKRAKWRAALVEDLELLKAGKEDEASDRLKDDVYPLLLDYLSGLDRYCASNQMTYSTLNQQISRQTTSSRHLLFGLSALPIALLFAIPALVLLLVVILVLFLMVKPVYPEETDGKWY